MAGLESLGGTARGGGDAAAFASLARCGEALRSAATFLRRFAPPGALAAVFFFMGIFRLFDFEHDLFRKPTSTFRDHALRRLAAIHQDMIVHSGPLATPCRRLGRPYVCGLCFWI